MTIQMTIHQNGQPALPGGDTLDNRTYHNTYRVLCMLAVVLNPAFGIVYGYTDPTSVDPAWVRLLFSAVFLGIFFLSYLRSWVYRNLVPLVHGLFYFMLAYYSGLTAWNHFSPNYAIGLLFAVTATSVAVSLGSPDRYALLRYLVYAALVPVLAIVVVPEPEVSPSIFSLSAFSSAFVIYLVGQARIRAEDKTHQSASYYRTLMKAANDAILIIDYDTNMLVDANKKAQELTGRSLDVICRMRPEELFPREQREWYASLLNDHILKGTPIVNHLQLEDQEGKIVPVDVNARLITLGEQRLVLAIFRDVTERQLYEQHLVETKEQAEELVQLKSSLINNMSHELRTPITAIRGYAELIGEMATGKPKAFAQTIVESADRLHRTLDAVLALAELESGHTPLSLMEVNVVQEIRERVKQYRPLAQQEGLSLLLIPIQEEITARLDKKYLHLILDHLIGNAIKFTREGQVKIIVEAIGSQVEIRIIDTGIGIREDFLPHMFEAFRQESEGLSRQFEGSGLGLAITLRLIELMGGRIEVHSEKDVGSTFKVMLSRDHIPSGRIVEPDDVGEEEATLQGEHVLLVEDNPYMLDFMERQLSARCRVTATTCAGEALQLARSEVFDFLIIDIDLSGQQSGFDVLRAIKNIPDYAHTPAIAVSAYALPRDHEIFFSAGFDRSLSKPFTRRQLIDTITRVLRSREAPGSSEVFYDTEG